MLSPGDRGPAAVGVVALGEWSFLPAEPPVTGFRLLRQWLPIALLLELLRSQTSSRPHWPVTQTCPSEAFPFV